MSRQTTSPRHFAFGKATPQSIREGLPASKITQLEALGLDRGTVIKLVGANSTIRRKIKEDATLSSQESDRLARVARITQQAIDVFGSRAKAVHWLSRPSRNLQDGRATPLEMLDTDPGAEQVKERLEQIAYGVFA